MVLESTIMDTAELMKYRNSCVLGQFSSTSRDCISVVIYRKKDTYFKRAHSPANEAFSLLFYPFTSLPRSSAGRQDTKDEGRGFRTYGAGGCCSRDGDSTSEVELSSTHARPWVAPLRLRMNLSAGWPLVTSLATTGTDLDDQLELQLGGGRARTWKTW